MIMRCQRQQKANNRRIVLLEEALKRVGDNQLFDSLMYNARIKQQDPSWVPSEEEITAIFGQALKTRKVGECTSILRKKIKEYLEVLLKSGKEELLGEVLENEYWRKVFAINYSAHSQLLKDNIFLNV